KTFRYRRSVRSSDHREPSVRTIAPLGVATTGSLADERCSLEITTSRTTGAALRYVPAMDRLLTFALDSTMYNDTTDHHILSPPAPHRLGAGRRRPTAGAIKRPRVVLGDQGHQHVGVEVHRPIVLDHVDTVRRRVSGPHLLVEPDHLGDVEPRPLPRDDPPAE